MKLSYFSLPLSCAAILLAFSGTASATTTLTFSKAGTARATGFANAAGTPTDGMRFGMVISTTDGNFAGSTGGYDAFDPNVNGFLTVGGLATDDYYFTAASFPTTSTQSATGTDPGGAGGIVSVALAPNGTDGTISGVTTSDPFSLIWFDGTPGSGGKYGMFSNGAFLLPASGTSVDFSSVFAGSTADPAKPANLSFALSASPEPSRALLLGLGSLGLVIRRRRKA